MKRLLPVCDLLWLHHLSDRNPGVSVRPALNWLLILGLLGFELVVIVITSGDIYRWLHHTLPYPAGNLWLQSLLKAMIRFGHQLMRLWFKGTLQSQKVMIWSDLLICTANYIATQLQLSRIAHVGSYASRRWGNLEVVPLPWQAHWYDEQSCNQCQ